MLEIFLIVSKGYQNSWIVAEKEKGRGVKERRWGCGRGVSVSRSQKHDKQVKQRINLL